MSPEQQELAEILLGTKALQFGQFRLKLHETNPEAPLSPFYFNFRLLRSYPRSARRVAQILAGATSSFAFDLLGDVPTAATPLVTLMMDIMGIPMISPRKGTKGYGSGAEIDGVFEAGQRVLLVDDLITSGGSKDEAVGKLERAQLKAAGLLVVLDREQGGSDHMAELGLPFKALVSLTPLLEHYRSTGAISGEQHASMVEYLGA